MSAQMLQLILEILAMIIMALIALREGNPKSGWKKRVRNPLKDGAKIHFGRFHISFSMA